MKNKLIVPTSQEKVMRETDFIVSKTDTKGILTYGNRIFIEFSGYTEDQLLGRQHNIIRHPDMPRCVFALLWDRLNAGEEISAYVKNMSKDGSFYWVYANVTPSRDINQTIVGYYSVRRKPSAAAMEVVPGLYQSLKLEESQHPSKQQIAAGTALLTDTLTSLKLSYDQFMYQTQG